MDKNSLRLYGSPEDMFKKKKTLGLVCTMKCNYDCPFCVWKFTEEVKGDQEISLDLFEKILKEFKKYGYEAVYLTGGEACLHSKFKELINLIVKYDYEFTFVTNGYYLEKYKFIVEDPNIKKHLQSLAISLDGNKKTHDLMRGRNAYQKVYEAVRYFKKNKVKVAVKIVVGKHNYKQLIPILKRVFNWGGDEIEFFFMILSKEYCLERDELQEVVDKVKANEKLIEEYSKKIKINIESLEMNRLEFCGSFKDKEINIMPNGRVTLCCAMYFEEFILGDLYKDFSIPNLFKNKYEKLLKIVTGNLERLQEPFILGTTLQDTCSLCRHYLKCEKDDGSVWNLYPKNSFGCELPDRTFKSKDNVLFKLDELQREKIKGERSKVLIKQQRVRKRINQILNRK